MPVEQIVEHDSWNYSPVKLPRQSKITLDSIDEVLPFDGSRNPGSRSAVAHRIWMTYRSAANNFVPKVGIAESAAEAAAAHELLIAPNLYDLRFQPFVVSFTDALGKSRRYTHDLLATFIDGRRRLVFVRNSDSLSKPGTWRDIEAIAAATPRYKADDMIVVNAGDYSRQRRENLFRLHEAIQQPDDETDDMVFWTARNTGTLWLMQNLFRNIDMPQSLIFRSCYRLIARGKLITNLDHVISEWSRIDVAP